MRYAVVFSVIAVTAGCAGDAGTPAPGSPALASASSALTGCTQTSCVQRATCNGVSGYPLALDGSPLCPPNTIYHNPVVIFAPHPDDDTLAMAGVMTAAKAAGRPVIVELMTAGDASGLCTANCKFDRMTEFLGAMSALGVDGYVGNDFGDGQTLSGGAPVASKDPTRVNFWLNLKNTGVVTGYMGLRGTAGTEDSPFNHNDHIAVRLSLQSAGYADTKWYAVYHHQDADRGTSAAWTHEANQAPGTVLNGLLAYKNSATRIGYGGFMGGFDCEIWDNGGGGPNTCPDTSGAKPAEDYALPYTPYCGDGVCSSGETSASCPIDCGGNTSGGACGEATCVPAQAAYISHFTNPGCTGTESYYLPYDNFAFNCRPWDGAGQCGTIQRTVTNTSYKYNGTCYDAWPSGNTLSQFVTVYRGSGTGGGACGEASCVPAQAAYISHFSAPGCTGTESYYLPYDNFGFSCRTWDGAGQCGTIQRTVTNYSYRYNGTCYDAWPSGNTLSQFVTVYR